MADVVGASDVHERLASITPCKGFLTLVVVSFGLRPHNNPSGFGAFPAFADAAADQFPLKLGKPAQHRQQSARREGLSCPPRLKPERELRAARSSGSGLAVMQPINLGSGEDPILDLDRCGALSRLGQIVQRDHCIAERWAINQYVAVYERRWLACVGIDFIFFASHVLP